MQTVTGPTQPPIDGQSTVRLEDPVATPTAKRRPTWLWITLAVVFVLLVGVITAVISGAFEDHGAVGTTEHSVKVPTDLVGKSAKAAEDELNAAGLSSVQLNAMDPSSQATCSAPATDDGCVVVGVPAAGQQEPVTGSVTLMVVAPAEVTPSAAAAPSTDTVTYTVTGKRSSSITYMNGGGDTSQVGNTTKLPWTTSFTVPAGSEGFLSVSAQNAGSGTIGCSISINGQVQKQNTSSGQYAIVDCSL